jgi:hypothetical protein
MPNKKRVRFSNVLEQLKITVISQTKKKTLKKYEVKTPCFYRFRKYTVFANTLVNVKGQIKKGPSFPTPPVATVKQSGFDLLALIDY